MPTLAETCCCHAGGPYRVGGRSPHHCGHRPSRRLYQMLRVCGRQSEVAGLHDCVAKGLVQQFPERGFHLAFQSTIRQVAGSLECRNRLLNASAFPGLCTKASNHKPVTTRLVRRHLWMSPGGFSMSRRDSDSEKVPAALYDRLTDTPTYAARMYKVQLSCRPFTTSRSRHENPPSRSTSLRAFFCPG